MPDRNSITQLEKGLIFGTMKKTRNTRNFNKIFQKIDLMIQRNFKKYKLEPEQIHPVKIEGKTWIM
jgi:hypothetical protein